MNIIIKPIVTEKATSQTETFNRYGFLVNPTANKIEIKKEIERRFKVVVENVNTIVHGGKVKQKNTKQGLVTSKAKRFKKAIVTLSKGDTIDFQAS